MTFREFITISPLITGDKLLSTCIGRMLFAGIAREWAAHARPALYCEELIFGSPYRAKPYD